MPVPAAPDHHDVPDVSGFQLKDLFRRDDPDLVQAIQDLISRMQRPAEASLGWQSFLNQNYTASAENSSTS
jgi:hypothetical protein